MLCNIEGMLCFVRIRPCEGGLIWTNREKWRFIGRSNNVFNQEVCPGFGLFSQQELTKLWCLCEYSY